MYQPFNIKTDMRVLTPGRRIKLYRGEEVILLKIDNHRIKLYKDEQIVDAFIGEISHTAGRRRR